jgi:hypothetical protein
MIDGMAPRTISVLTEMWITDSRAPNHRDGIDNAERSDRLEPPAGGTLFRYFEVAPESQTAHLSKGEKRKASAKSFAEMKGAHLQPDTSRHATMHRSSTTDYIILLSGQITLILDKDERTLTPFDCVIQRWDQSCLG